MKSGSYLFLKWIHPAIRVIGMFPTSCPLPSDIYILCFPSYFMFKMSSLEAESKLSFGTEKSVMLSCLYIWSYFVRFICNYFIICDLMTRSLWPRCLWSFAYFLVYLLFPNSVWLQVMIWPCCMWNFRSLRIFAR